MIFYIFLYCRCDTMYTLRHLICIDNLKTNTINFLSLKPFSSSRLQKSLTYWVLAILLNFSLTPLLYKQDFCLAWLELFWIWIHIETHAECCCICLVQFQPVFLSVGRILRTSLARNGNISLEKMNVFCGQSLEQIENLSLWSKQKFAIQKTVC